MEYTIANIRILDVVRLVHGYFIFVFLTINMLSKKNRSVVELETQIWQDEVRICIRPTRLVGFV